MLPSALSGKGGKTWLITEREAYLVVSGGNNAYSDCLEKLR